MFSTSISDPRFYYSQIDGSLRRAIFFVPALESEIYIGAMHPLKMASLRETLVKSMVVCGLSDESRERNHLRHSQSPENARELIPCKMDCNAAILPPVGLNQPPSDITSWVGWAATTPSIQAACDWRRISTQKSRSLSARREDLRLRERAMITL